MIDLSSVRIVKVEKTTKDSFYTEYGPDSWKMK